MPSDRKGSKLTTLRVCFAICLGYVLGILSGHAPHFFPYGFGNDLQHVTDRNTEIMHEIGRISTLLEFNSDLMMRFSHYAMPHTKKITYCPECYGRGIERLYYRPGEEEQLQGTIHQVRQDSDEIGMSLQRVRFSLLNQANTLTMHLSRLKQNDTDTTVQPVRHQATAGPQI